MTSMVVLMMAGLAANANPSDYLYTAMTPEQLSAAIARCPVAYIPAGIAEWHGEQSACGLDALKAETLCEMAGRQLGGVVFPTIWTGPGGSTPFNPGVYPRGTLTIDKQLYFTAADELLTQLEAMGFKVAVYLSGHYPGIIPEVARKFNRNKGGMKVITLSENQVVEGMPAGDHAGAWETAVLMALRPGLVDLSRLPALPKGVEHAGDCIPKPWFFLQRCEYYGIYGADPRIWANMHFGRKGTEAILDGLARKVREALEDDSYAQQRGEITWPRDERAKEEVRYDFQLPSQWMKRFEEAPIVYWPLPVIGESIEDATARAEMIARKTGGMVFPAFPFGPPAEKSSSGLAVSRDVYQQITTEVVHVLAGMDFRVIGLLPGPGLDASCRRNLSEIGAPDGQAGVVIIDPDDSATVPASVRGAIAGSIPPKDAEVIELDGPWKINNKRTVESLREVVYGPPAELRVYEHEFELNDEQAWSRVMLDLGTVENHAEINMNETTTLTDHWPPYRVNISHRLRGGTNRLQIVIHHKPQPTLDEFYYLAGPPRLKGPVKLYIWKP